MSRLGVDPSGGLGLRTPTGAHARVHLHFARAGWVSTLLNRRLVISMTHVIRYGPTARVDHDKAPPGREDSHAFLELSCPFTGTPSLGSALRSPRAL